MNKYIGIAEGVCCNTGTAEDIQHVHAGKLKFNGAQTELLKWPCIIGKFSLAMMEVSLDLMLKLGGYSKQTQE